MNDQSFDFFQDHSLHYLEMALRTDRAEPIAQPDGHGIKTGDCGDTVEFFISTAGDRIRQMGYHTDGCINTNACANTVVQLAEGKTLDEAWEITPDDVAGYLETLPEGHFHCAELAVGAFYIALADLRETAQKPWKKLYR